MADIIEVPVPLIETLASLRLPPGVDRHLQSLMAKNTEGMLTAGERDGLAALAELSESIALVRAQALHLLGRRPV